MSYKLQTYPAEKRLNTGDTSWFQGCVVCIEKETSESHAGFYFEHAESPNYKKGFNCEDTALKRAQAWLEGK